MRVTLLLTLSILLRTTGYSQAPQLQPGDLLFQDSDCGPFCDAIEKVTEGVDGLDFSHVGMVVMLADTLVVVEAGGNGVVLSPIDTFLQRSLSNDGKPKVVLGRLKENKWAYKADWQKLLASYLGLGYDSEFELGDDEYYCSELVEDIMQDVTGKPFFEVNGMTFKDPDTDDFFPIWVNYFEDLGIPIPEGEPGYNPGMMSRSEKLEIIYKYY